MNGRMAALAAIIIAAAVVVLCFRVSYSSVYHVYDVIMVWYSILLVLMDTPRPRFCGGDIFI